MTTRLRREDNIGMQGATLISTCDKEKGGQVIIKTLDLQVEGTKHRRSSRRDGGGTPLVNYELWENGLSEVHIINRNERK